MLETEFLIWQTEVRDYEVDYQGIVNNACYFNYLDHARAKYLQHYNISITQHAQDKKNIVVLKTSINFKKSLQFGDCFSVLSRIQRISRFKFVFYQEIFLDSNPPVLVATSDSIIACINNGKPCILKELDNMQISHD